MYERYEIKTFDRLDLVGMFQRREAMPIKKQPTLGIVVLSPIGGAHRLLSNL